MVVIETPAPFILRAIAFCLSSSTGGRPPVRPCCQFQKWAS